MFVSQSGGCESPSLISNATGSLRLQEWSSNEEEEDLSQQGLAVHSILSSIPPHMLRALESQQSTANTVNAETQVYLSLGVAVTDPVEFAVREVTSRQYCLRCAASSSTKQMLT